MRRWILWTALIVLAVVTASVYHERFESERALGRLRARGAYVEDHGRVVVLGSERFTDSSLGDLLRVGPVEDLTLIRTQVTDRGYSQLAGLVELRRLEINGSRIGAAGLIHLARLPHLSVLKLIATPVSDRDLEQLSGMRQLECLDLSGAAVSSDGMRHLVALQGLRILNLRMTAVDDDAVVHLRRLPLLEVIVLESTDVTSAGILDLEDVLKHCNVRR